MARPAASPLSTMIDLGFFGVVILFRMILDSFHDRDEKPSRSLKDPTDAICSPAVSPAWITISSPIMEPLSTWRVESIAAVLVRRDDEYLIASGPFAQRTNRYGDDIKFGTDRNPDAY